MYTQPHQFTSPEVHPIAARSRLVEYSATQLKAVIILSHPELKGHLAARQVVREQMKVPEIIDYTTENRVTINPDLVSSDVSLEGYNQDRRVLDAEKAVEEAHKEQYGLAA